MKRYEIMLYCSYTDKHKECIKKLLNALNLEVVEECKISITVNVPEELICVIEDLNDCDYLKAIHV